MSAEARDRPVSVVVDVANVMGSRPDGWWRDRAAAASRLLDGMPALVGRVVATPDGDPMRIGRIVAVVEGAAKAVEEPEGVTVVRASTDGDSAIVSTTERLHTEGERVLVVTADRGLRDRLPGGVLAAGPNWLNDLLGR
ncbi:MAG TPA: hypothetical protein VFG92_02930 [Agromyces sp.]|nr:hypothetical protein [Agromyces sp.]